MEHCQDHVETLLLVVVVRLKLELMVVQKLVLQQRQVEMVQQI